MHSVVCNNLLEIQHTLQVGYQEGQVGSLVGVKVDVSRLAEQCIGKRLD